MGSVRPSEDKSGPEELDSAQALVPATHTTFEVNVTDTVA